jgi:hypothetical protein
MIPVVSAVVTMFFMVSSLMKLMSAFSVVADLVDRTAPITTIPMIIC